MIGCLTNKKEAQEVFEQLIIKYDLNNLQSAHHHIHIIYIMRSLIL